MKIFGINVPEGSEITNATMSSGTSFPANEAIGEQFFRTDLDEMFVRNSTEWVPAETSNKELTYMSATSYNSMFLVLNGKLYTAAGDSASNNNGATGRHLDGQHTVKGCDNFKEASLPSASPIVKVGSPGLSGYALLENGELYTWGYNEYGICGLGYTAQVAFPTLAEVNVTDVYDHPTNVTYSAGSGKLIIRKSDGYLYGAGNNGYGQLGLGDTTARSTFTQMTSLGTNILNAWNMGSHLGCVIVQKTDHTIWIAGYNGYGQFGNGVAVATNTTFADVTAAWGGGSGYVLKQVIGGFGYYSTAAVFLTAIGMLLDNGITTILKMSGEGTQSNLGHGSSSGYVTTPVTPNVGSGRISKVAFMGALGGVYCLKEDGDLYVWGRNAEGVLADGTTVAKNSPFVTMTDVTDIFCDGWNSHTYGYLIQSYIKKTDGQLYMAGHNGGGYYGGIGSSTTNITSFTRVLLPWGLDVQMMGSFNTSANGRTTLAAGANGKIYAWGYGSYYGVNSNSVTHLKYPSQINITNYNK